MRLLVVTERLQDNPTNGAEAFAACLLRVLAREHRVSVVCRPPSAGARALEGIARVEVADELLAEADTLTSHLRERVAVNDYDLLYNLGNLAFGARICAFLLILAPRLPMVNHFQTVLAEYSRIEGLDATALRQAAASQALCAQLGSLSIFSSLSEYRAAVEHALPVAGKPAAVVPNGLAMHEFEGVEPDRDILREAGLALDHAGESRPPFVALAAGRFSDFAKGGDIGYRAFLRLHAAAPHARLAVVSDDHRFRPILDALPPGCAARLPWLERPRFLRVLAAADAVLIPSRYEAFGLAAAEAMALGKPVAANAVGGLQEIVLHERTGLLAEPGSGSLGLGDALIRLSRDSALCERLGQAASLHARREFDIERVARLVERELARGFQHAHAAANVSATGIELR